LHSLSTSPFSVVVILIIYGTCPSFSAFFSPFAVVFDHVSARFISFGVAFPLNSFMTLSVLLPLMFTLPQLGELEDTLVVPFRVGFQL